MRPTQPTLRPRPTPEQAPVG